MKNNFNFIAPIYDCLSKIIFGNSLLKAQTHFFSEIPNDSKILIVGGGSGKILPHLIKERNPAEIHFVEKSAKMIELAQKKVKDKVKFIHQDYESYEINEKYDVVMTFFFFDVFEETKAFELMKKTVGFLAEKGTWLLADFHFEEGQNLIQKQLIKLMYFFFKIVSKIESNRLPNFPKLLNQLDININKTSFYAKKLVFSSCIKHYSSQRTHKFV